MDMADFKELDAAHEEALEAMRKAGKRIAEEYLAGHVSDEAVKEWEIAVLGESSTKRDLDYCMNLELASLDG